MTMHSRSHASRSPVFELLATRASQTPARPAFIEGSGARALSWEAIARHANDLTATLASADGGRRVGLAIDSASQYCSTYLAALASGLCIAPLDPRATHDEIRRQVGELGLTDLLLDAPTAGLAGPLLGSGADVWCVGSQGLVGEQRRHRAQTTTPSIVNVHRAKAPRANHRHPIGPAVILRTSGSTGRPKLIPLTQAQVLYGASQIVAHHRLTRDDRGYCPLPLFHINAQVVGILSTLVSGGSLVVDRRLARDRFWDTVEGSGATWLNLVPAILAKVSELSASADLSAKVRFARSASSHLADPIRRRFEEVTGISVLETYGMTEASGQISANPLNPAERRPGSVGLPVGLELRVVSDNDSKVMPTGQVGVVQIKGPSVISAYLGQKGAGEAVPARTPDGWLSTGDLAWRDSDGFVFLMGRTDDLINRGGEKLYPSEIEAVLMSDPRVAAASAVGRPHPSLGAVPVAFVVVRQGGNDPGTADPAGADGDADGRARLVEDLHRACSRALSFYKRPVEITVADRLPVGATGKIQRAAVRDLVAGAT